MPRKKAGLAKAELGRETSKILRLKEEIAKNFWDLGSCLVRVNDMKLYQASGYQFFEEYLKKDVKIGKSTAYRLMDLARNFSRETAIKFGQSKLLGAIAYAKATPKEDLPIDVTRYEIEVKTGSGKKTTKTFDQASVREIKRAAELLRKKLKPEKKTPFPIPALAGLLSGKKPKFSVGPFIKKAREKLKDVSPRPTMSLSITKQGTDPLVELRLGNVRASSLLTVFGLLASAALEAWMGSVK